MTMAALLPGAQDRTNLVHSKMAAREIHFWGVEANRALCKMFFKLPDAAAYAGNLVLTPAGDALKRAVKGRAGWRAASEPDAALLRPWGLCEARGRGLMNFGCDVRLAIGGVN